MMMMMMCVCVCVTRDSWPDTSLRILRCRGEDIMLALRPGDGFVPSFRRSCRSLGMGIIHPRRSTDSDSYYFFFFPFLLVVSPPD